VKEFWYFVLVMLMLGILAGFIGMSSPTGAVVINFPPKWDFPTTEFVIDGVLELDLNKAFFDSDGDPLAFSVSPGPGVSAGVEGDLLIVYAESEGELMVTASDGSALVSQKIIVRSV